MLRIFLFLMFLAFAMSEYNYAVIIHHDISKLSEMVIEKLNDGWQLAGGATVTAPMYNAFSQTMFRVNS